MSDIVERLAAMPTKSTAHMSADERADGIAQMLADLDQLARRDGCIAAAWATEAIETLAREIETLRERVAAQLEIIDSAVECRERLRDENAALRAQLAALSKERDEYKKLWQHAIKMRGMTP